MGFNSAFKVLIYGKNQHDKTNCFENCAIRKKNPQKEENRFELRFIFSLLHRACCFNYFFNIPTNAHNIYTLKSTKIHTKNT